MNINKWLLSFVYRFKPIIVKIISIDYLRARKARLLERNTKRLEKVKVEAYNSEKGEKGINLIGYIRHDTGLGQSTRLLAAELKKSEIPFAIKPYSQSREYSMTDLSFDEYCSDALPYNINVFHINPHEFTVAYLNLGKNIFDEHYNIAFWLWEMEEFPEEWLPCISILDEIWTPSEFISKALRKKTDKPVITIPYAISAPTKAEMDREYFSLPENVFLFLGMYDSNSVAERKNPKGIIRAFKQAFERDSKEVGLVLKINHIKDNEMAYIKEELKGYENIYYILSNLSKVEVNSLIECVDVYMSLHRAEGFGLVLAEAMLLGTPTIATNYSANVEFMNQDVACMVDYEMVTLEEDVALYHKGYKWAEPNEQQAAMYMKRLFEDKGYYTEKKNKAQEFIKTKLGFGQAMLKIQERFSEICHM